jgi:hypothetical protein
MRRTSSTLDGASSGRKESEFKILILKGEVQLRLARRFFPPFLTLNFSVARGFDSPANAPQTNQNVRVIEVTTGAIEKYPEIRFIPGRVKRQRKQTRAG